MKPGLISKSDKLVFTLKSNEVSFKVVLKPKFCLSLCFEKRLMRKTLRKNQKGLRSNSSYFLAFSIFLGWGIGEVMVYQW